ncbi:unnamed protein product [Rangifer tarandus platyrhynchus]|uniref:Uncharacterized protein n=2 Tax=Rangifer tarandus platyrhynchus TaxID=3082113 RepID=A0AC59ZXR0_RANTA|nr:unnamed protein product [Rangifer tarandus platyrhynchus]
MGLTPPVWENLQLWGSLCPVGKGEVHTHRCAHTHTHTQPDTHEGSQTHIHRHTAWGLGKQEGPSKLWPLDGAIASGPLCCGRPTGVPQEPSPARCGDRAAGHSCSLCTDSHYPPAIPRHILFNNLSLLNYLLAFTTSPPPPCPPLSPSASSHESRKWKQQKKTRHQYICK